MLKDKGSGRNRVNTEINAGSMADIAFLLLIFFLVTTTIAEDEGILVRLPQWSDEPVETAKLKERNVCNILVNANDQLLVDSEIAKLSDLRERVKDFIMNPNNSDKYAESPDKAVVSLQNDNGTKYVTYLQVYNEIQAAYNELRDNEAQKRHNKLFEFLTDAQKREIIEIIPLKLSEAEPTDFGDTEE